MNEVQDRIAEIINVCFERNTNRASREFQIPQSSLINITKGKRNKPSFDNVIKIITNKRININPEWFLFGKGNMFIDNESSPQIDNGNDIDYKELYDEAIKEVGRLKSKIIEIYEMQLSVKNEYPNAMGGVKGAQAV